MCVLCAFRTYDLGHYPQHARKPDSRVRRIASFEECGLFRAGSLTRGGGTSEGIDPANLVRALQATDEARGS
jgi:hypothetical protein